MKRTVKELITDLLHYPMDAAVVIAINGKAEHEIDDIVKYAWEDKLFLEVEIPEERTDELHELHEDNQP